MSAGQLGEIAGPVLSGVNAYQNKINYVYTNDDLQNLQTLQVTGIGDTSYTYTTAIDEDPTTNQVDVVTLPSGLQVDYDYDAAGRVVQRRTLDGSTVVETVSFVYRADDTVATLEDANGTTSYAYEAGTGRLQKITYPSGQEVSYTYTSVGRIHTITTKATTVGTAHVSEYSYDAAGNIEWVEYTAPGGTKYRTTYAYDEANRPTDRTLPTGVTTEWTYDTRDRITSIIHKKSNGTVIASYTYDHPQTGVGEPHRITREDGSYVDLAYDAALRLESEAYHAPGGALLETITYSYDASGNRTAKTVTDTTTDSYDYAILPGYKLDGVDGPGSDDLDYGYDAGGRVTSINRAGQAFSLGYNAGDQINSVTGAATVSYAYDGAGRRTSASSGASTRNFLVAPTAGGEGLESTQLISDGAGGVLAGYVYGPNSDAPLLRFDASGAPVYYLEDAMDSIGATVDQAEATLSKVTYDAFGIVRSTTGAGLAGPPNAGGDFGFHGAWREGATGLYHMHARDYDASTGRFTSRDPVLGAEQLPESYNAYAYGLNNPHLYSDTSGEFSIAEITFSGAKQVSLQQFRTVALNQARKYAVKKGQGDTHRYGSRDA